MEVIFGDVAKTEDGNFSASFFRTFNGVLPPIEAGTLVTFFGVASGQLSGETGSHLIISFTGDGPESSIKLAANCKTSEVFKVTQDGVNT